MNQVTLTASKPPGNYFGQPTAEKSVRDQTDSPITTGSWTRDHLIHRWLFPVCGPLSPSRYLQPLSRYWALSILGHDLDLSGSRDVIGHVTIRIAMGHFILVVHWIQEDYISNGFRDILPQTSRAHW